MQCAAAVPLGCDDPTTDAIDDTKAQPQADADTERLNSVTLIGVATRPIRHPSSSGSSARHAGSSFAPRHRHPLQPLRAPTLCIACNCAQRCPNLSGVAGCLASFENWPIVFEVSGRFGFHSLARSRDCAHAVSLNNGGLCAASGNSAVMSAAGSWYRKRVRTNDRLATTAHGLPQR